MYNFISTFDELNKLYEEVEVKKVEEACKDELTEAADDEEIEIVDDEASAEEVPTEEAPAEEPVVEDEPRQVICECDKCGALVIVDEADIKVDAEADLVNVDDECKFCEETAGYKIIGTLAPYEAVEEESEEVTESLLEAADDTKLLDKFKQVLFKALDKNGKQELKDILENTVTMVLSDQFGVAYDKNTRRLAVSKSDIKSDAKKVVAEIIKEYDRGTIKPKTTATQFKSNVKDFIEILTKKYHQKPTILKDEKECVFCGGDIDPKVDEYNTVKCAYCSTRYFDSEQYGKIAADCPICGGYIDPAEDCKCAYCGTTLSDLKIGECGNCGAKLDAKGECKYCGNKSKEELKKEAENGGAVQEDLADVARKVFDKPASIATQQRWEDELNDDSISPARRRHLMKKFAQQRDWEEKHPDKEVK